MTRITFEYTTEIDGVQTPVKIEAQVLEFHDPDELVVELVNVEGATLSELSNDEFDDLSEQAYIQYMKDCE